MDPLVSILIPAYNAEAWIADTIKSAVDQTWPRREVIIVDDGSTDRTLSIAQEFVSSEVTVVSERNRGAASARNRALAISRGDYIQWLDADDLLAPDKIATQMRAVNHGTTSRTLLSGAFGRFIYRPVRAQFSPTALWCDLSPFEWLLRKLEQNLYMQTATWLVSRELAEAAGPWDTRLLSDDDGEYFCRVLLASDGVRFVGEARIFYRSSGGNSLSHVGQSVKKQEALFLSMQLHIRYIRSIEDSERVKSACLVFLQRWLVYFYPERRDLVEQAQRLAAQLGGHLETPRLPWKYACIQKLFGWTAAKRAQARFNKVKFSLLRSLDEGLFRFDTAGNASPPSLPVMLRLAGSDEANDRHFRTDHLLANLKNRTLSGGFITLTSQSVQFALNLASIVILARLLSPRDFGLIAMVWTIIGFLRVFKEAGLSTATVQREGITHAQVSNLFWINVMVSGLISLSLAAGAPVVAWFFREPRLVGITVALSITFLLAGSAVQHMALLNRQMRFKAIALIQVGSVLAGILVGVGMAWLEYGYWSLVGMNLTTNMVVLLMTWAASRWRPQSFTWHSGTRSLLHFGANLTAGTFLYSLARGLDGILIGRYFGAASVGIYSRAAALITRPLEQFIYPMEGVFLPAFSRLRSQPDRYRSSFLEVYESIALTSFLYTGICFTLAHPLTLVVLGPRWEKAAIIFAGFTFAALQFPLSSFANWLLTSQGRGRESFLANSIISVIVALSFIAGLPFGPIGVAISYSASCLLVQMPILYYVAGRNGPVSTGDLWMGFFRQLPLWVVVSLATWLVRRPLPDDQPLKEVLIAGSSGLLAGAAFIFVYGPARRVALNLLSTVRGLKNPA